MRIKEDCPIFKNTFPKLQGASHEDYPRFAELYQTLAGNNNKRLKITADQAKIVCAHGKVIKDRSLVGLVPTLRKACSPLTLSPLTWQ